MLSKLLPEPLGLRCSPGFLGQGEGGHGIDLADYLVLAAVGVEAVGGFTGTLLVLLVPVRRWAVDAQGRVGFCINSPGADPKSCLSRKRRQLSVHAGSTCRPGRGRWRRRSLVRGKANHRGG